MTVEETIRMLMKMPPKADFACLLGCGRKFVAADLDPEKIQIVHRERGSNQVVADATETSEPVVAIVL